MEREGGGTQKGGGDCVRSCVLYMNACTCICSYYIRASHTHTHTQKYTTRESPRESLSMCRMSVRAKEEGKRHVEGWQRVSGKHGDGRFRGRLRGNVGW